MGPASRACSLTDWRRGAARIDDIVTLLEANKFQGADHRLRGGSASGRREDLRDFLSELSSAFTAHGLAMVLAVPSTTIAGPTPPMRRSPITSCSWADDQHWDQTRAGSIAGEDLVRGTPSTSG